MSRQQIRVFSLAHGRTTNVKRERELVRRTNRHRSLTASLQSPPGVSDHLRRARERRGGRPTARRRAATTAEMDAAARRGRWLASRAGRRGAVSGIRSSRCCL